MITARTVKLTKNGQQMAFVTLEDMVGSVEVIVFPRDYENKKQLLMRMQRCLSADVPPLGMTRQDG